MELTTECGCFATDDHPPGFVKLASNKRTYSSSPLTHEQTIRAVATCSGIGLHSGAPVSLRILPAPAGTGIVFRRVDLDGFAIEASGRNVARVSYATSLMKKGVLISTTEHLLSAFMGWARQCHRRTRQPGVADPRWQRPADCASDSEAPACADSARRALIIAYGARSSCATATNSLPFIPPTFTSYTYSHQFSASTDRQAGVHACARATEVISAQIAPARTFGFLHEARRAATAWI